jgi:hypothetical protein
MIGSRAMNPVPEDRRLLAPAALLSGAALVLPLWVGRLLPLLDLPQHLAVVSVLRHHGDAQWGFAPFFEVQWGELTPYWTYYLVTWALSSAMSVETASRVVLSAYALAGPWIGIALCRAFGRSPWLGLLAAPLALNTNLYFGFVSYALAVLLALALLAVFERSFDRETGRRALVLLFGTALLFFTHVQAFALFLAVAGLAAVTRTERRWTERLMRLVPLLPALLGLFVPWCYLQFVAPREAVSGRYTFGRLGRLGASLRSPWDAVRDLPDALAGAFQDRSDAWLLALWVALVVAAAPTVSRRLLPFLLALATYLVAPVSIVGQWNIGPRLAWPAALLLLPALSAAGRRARRVGQAAVALTVVVAANAAWHHAAFDREAGAFDEAIAALPRGTWVMPLIFEPRGYVLDKWPYLHVGQYAMVRRGGVAAGTLGRIPAFPIRLRDADVVRDLDPFRPQDFRLATHGHAYDYFLLRGGAEPRDALFPPGTVEPVFEGEEWVLLRRR